MFLRVVGWWSFASILSRIVNNVSGERSLSCLLLLLLVSFPHDSHRATLLDIQCWLIETVVEGTIACNCSFREIRASLSLFAHHGAVSLSIAPSFFAPLYLAVYRRSCLLKFHTRYLFFPCAWAMDEVVTLFSVAFPISYPDNWWSSLFPNTSQNFRSDTRPLWQTRSSSSRSIRVTFKFLSSSLRSRREQEWRGGDSSGENPVKKRRLVSIKWNSPPPIFDRVTQESRQWVYISGGGEEG